MNKLRDRNIAITYLPGFLRAFREFQALMGVTDLELDKVDSKTVNVLNNAFIETADEDAVARYEDISGTVPNENDTIEDRKARLMTVFRGTYPYTLNNMKKQLEQLVGVNLIMKVDNVKNVLHVEIPQNQSAQYDTVISIIKNALPMNMVLDDEYRVERWYELEDVFKWEDLERFTWEDIETLYESEVL